MSEALRVLEAEFRAKVGNAEAQLAATLADEAEVARDTGGLAEELARAEAVFEWALLDLETAQNRADSAAARKRAVCAEVCLGLGICI